MSLIRANNILDAAGGNTATINGMTPTAQSLQGFRNRIINGSMVIDQRNAGASVTNTAATVYGVDRWGLYGSQASKATVQQNAGGVTPPAGFTNYVGVTIGAAANVSLGAADIFQLFQAVELFNVSDFAYGTAAAQPITLSFWVRSSLTGTFSGSVYSAGSYPFTYAINAANTWEQKTVSIPANTGISFQNTSGNTTGLTLTFDLGAGSNWTAAAGSWGSGTRTKATGSVNVITTNGATFYITGVQLEAGSVATPFERRDYGRELMMCQRYCFAQRATSSFYSFGISTSNSTVPIALINFPVPMRSSPTLLSASAGSTFFFGSGSATTINLDQVSETNGFVWGSGGANATAGFSGRFLANNTTSAFLIWSSEL